MLSFDPLEEGCTLRMTTPSDSNSGILNFKNGEKIKHPIPKSWFYLFSISKS